MPSGLSVEGLRLQVTMSLYRLSTVHSHAPRGRVQLNLTVYTFMPLRFGSLLHSSLVICSTRNRR